MYQFLCLTLITVLGLSTLLIKPPTRVCSAQVNSNGQTWPTLLSFQSRQLSRANQKVRVRATIVATQKIVEPAFAVDGKLIATTMKDGSMLWWDALSGAPAVRGPNSAVVRTPIEIGHGILDTEDFESLLSKLQGAEGVSARMLSPDNRMLLTTKGLGDAYQDMGWWILQLWDLGTGQLRMTSENVRAPSRIFWSPNSKTMVVVGYRGTETRLLNTQTGRVVMKLPYKGCVSDKLFGSTGCEPWIFSNDSRLMIRQEGPLKLWNAETGELIAELESARAPAAFSPTNSRIFATLSKDKGKALLWEVLD